MFTKWPIYRFVIHHSMYTNMQLINATPTPNANPNLSNEEETFWPFYVFLISVYKTLKTTVRTIQNDPHKDGKK